MHSVVNHKKAIVFPTKIDVVYQWPWINECFCYWSMLPFAFIQNSWFLNIERKAWIRLNLSKSRGGAKSKILLKTNGYKKYKVIRLSIDCEGLSPVSYNKITIYLSLFCDFICCCKVILFLSSHDALRKDSNVIHWR